MRIRWRHQGIHDVEWVHPCRDDSYYGEPSCLWGHMPIICIPIHRLNSIWIVDTVCVLLQCWISTCSAQVRLARRLQNRHLFEYCDAICPDTLNVSTYCHVWMQTRVETRTLCENLNVNDLLRWIRWTTCSISMESGEKVRIFFIIFHMYYSIDDVTCMCSEGEPGHPEHGLQCPDTRDQKASHGACSSLMGGITGPS